MRDAENRIKFEIIDVHVDVNVNYKFVEATSIPAILYSDHLSKYVNVLSLIDSAFLGSDGREVVPNISVSFYLQRISSDDLMVGQQGFLLINRGREESDKFDSYFSAIKVVIVEVN